MSGRLTEGSGVMLTRIVVGIERVRMSAVSRTGTSTDELEGSGSVRSSMMDSMTSIGPWGGLDNSPSSSLDGAEVSMGSSV